jgi:hypothetical protein
MIKLPPHLVNRKGILLCSAITPRTVRQNFLRAIAWRVNGVTSVRSLSASLPLNRPLGTKGAVVLQERKLFEIVFPRHLATERVDIFFTVTGHGA